MVDANAGVSLGRADLDGSASGGDVSIDLSASRSGDERIGVSNAGRKETNGANDGENGKMLFQFILLLLFLKVRPAARYESVFFTSSPVSLNAAQIGSA